jgi:hypothetical protein
MPYVGAIAETESTMPSINATISDLTPYVMSCRDSSSD